jgi:hypothetical protein
MVDGLERGDDGGSEWAEEGTRAHGLAEIEASYAFDLTTQEQYHAFKADWLRKAERHGDDVEEMEGHARTYVSLLLDIAAGMEHPHLRLETRVQTGVPGCWGTADATLLDTTRVAVVDYKYGQGVPVYAEDNPQLMLYSVGALDLLDLLGTVETVDMWICQPRVGDGVSRFAVTADSLRRWRDEDVRPVAAETQMPDAHFGPGEAACRWCPAAGVCKPRMAWVTQRDFGNPDAMDPEELAEAVLRLPEVRDWCNAVEAEALHQAYSEGTPLPGLKVVLSGGKRSIPDPEAAILALTAAGFDRDAVARTGIKTLGDLEKLVGKRRLPEVLGGLLVKSRGKPALVPEDDPRTAITPASEAAKDFLGEGPG